MLGRDRPSNPPSDASVVAVLVKVLLQHEMEPVLHWLSRASSALGAAVATAARATMGRTMEEGRMNIFREFGWLVGLFV